MCDGTHDESPPRPGPEAEGLRVGEREYGPLRLVLETYDEPRRHAVRRNPAG